MNNIPKKYHPAIRRLIKNARDSERERTTNKEEKYLFKIVNKVLQWAQVKASKEEIADLIMLDLLNIKRE
jgi:hypothetical protein